MLKFIPLGGLGEIGLNIMVFEYRDSILIVDAGLMFPEDFMPGVDLVIPDFQYLRENHDKLCAIILTHGHEDHIGAMPFLLREFNLPVYGTRFTLELLKEKLREHKLLSIAKLTAISPGEILSIDDFQVEFISVNHSIVDGVGLAISTPEGIIVHSGDFKIDPTPVDGQATDLARFAAYGSKGVLALLSDSTNAEKEGFTLSEQDVKKSLEDFFQASRGRIIVAVFASNITRIQQVINLAMKYGRKVMFSGKSMLTNVQIARKEGFLHFPEDQEIGEKQIDQFPDDKLAIITTGSQGEPMSALARMVQGAHRNIKIRQGDTVILSSRFIPGNERAITAIINKLYEQGADVAYEKISEIHTSGHAKREELKLLLGLVKPKFFVPIHGEIRHLIRHIQLAAEMGIPQDNLLLATNGSVICFEKQKASFAGRVPTGRVLVDGKGLGDIGDSVLKERRRLSENGVFIVLLVLNQQTGDIVYGPDVISRGFVFEEEARYIIEDAKYVVLEVLDDEREELYKDESVVKEEIKRRLAKFFHKVIERRPVILPLIVHV
ncbi:MAG: ribonuclease J [Deltaproteobacteria bacterium]|nr:ribonuclease J [Deltaproteobacteria bacterium]MBW2081931.1 ribonuclease J [Deltaproteobacteria bacterium]HDM09220.1 ribonuclease J [Desulfobacteraceae bacterium]